MIKMMLQLTLILLGLLFKYNLFPFRVNNISVRRNGGWHKQTAAIRRGVCNNKKLFCNLLPFFFTIEIKFECVGVFTSVDENKIYFLFLAFLCIFTTCSVAHLMITHLHFSYACQSLSARAEKKIVF